MLRRPVNGAGVVRRRCCLLLSHPAIRYISPAGQPRRLQGIITTVHRQQLSISATRGIGNHHGKMFDGVPLGEVVGSHEAARPARVTLEGRSVTLAPISASHVPSLYQTICVDSPDAVFAYMFAGPFDGQEPFRRHVEAMVTSEDPLFLTVIPKEPLPGLPAGTPAGYLSIMRADVKARAVEIGHITLSQALQRTTAATEALYLAMRHCMEDLGYRRLEWKCHSLNAKSMRAADRLGFVFEGIFRKHMIVRGRNRDTAWYTIVDDEWPSRKDALERWLEPGNFTDGKQVKSLSEIRRDLTA